MTIKGLWLLLCNKPVKYRFANMSMQNYPAGSELRQAAEFARSAIDRHLGDSDPPDGSDDPLFIACQKLSAALERS